MNRHSGIESMWIMLGLIKETPKMSIDIFKFGGKGEITGKSLPMRIFFPIQTIHIPILPHMSGIIVQADDIRPHLQTIPS